MALLQFVHDTATKKKKAVPYPGFIDKVFTVTGSPQSQFDLGIDVDADHAILVEVDGRGQLEDTHWTRDTGNNRVNTSSAVNVGSWLRARVFYK